MGPYEGVGAVSVRGRGQSRLSRDPYVVPYEGVGSIEIIEGPYEGVGSIEIIEGPYEGVGSIEVSRDPHEGLEWSCDRTCGRPGVHQPPEEAAYRKFTRISRATGGVPNRAGAARCLLLSLFFARRLATGFRVGKGHCRSIQGSVSATYDLQHMGKI